MSAGGKKRIVILPGQLLQVERSLNKQKKLKVRVH